MLMRLETVVAIVLVALVVSVGVGPSAAVGAAAGQQSQRGPDAAHTTTVVTQPAAREERSAPITVLLVGLGAAAGVIIGVLPALVAAMALGYLPPPRRRARHASRVLAEPVAVRARLRPTPASRWPPRPDAVAEEPSRDAPRQGQLAILAHARHQDVYDTAYAQQLERVGALRSAIGDRRRRVSRAAERPRSSTSRERNLMMLPSSSCRRPWRPPAQLPTTATLLALLALAAWAPASAWAQAPPAPPGPPPGNGGDLPVPPGTAPPFVPPGSPGAIPGATTGPGLLGNAPVNLNRARRTFSIPLACQQNGSVRVTAKVVSKAPLARAGYRCAANRATARLSVSAKVAKQLVRRKVVAATLGVTQAGRSSKLYFQLRAGSARQAGDGLLDRRAPAVRRRLGRRRRPTSSSPTSRPRRRRRCRPAAGSPGTRPPAAGTGSASTARARVGGTRGPRR